VRLLSWQVPSLPRVECYLPRQLDTVVPLQHLGSTLRPEPLADGRRMGDTAWGALHRGQLIALSWDWLEIVPGVVCVVDPANVLTNIRFLDAHDCYEEPVQAIVSANRLLHSTPWQPTVLGLLGAAPRAVRAEASARGRRAA